MESFGDKIFHQLFCSFTHREEPLTSWTPQYFKCVLGDSHELNLSNITLSWRVNTSDSHLHSSLR